MNVVSLLIWGFFAFLFLAINYAYSFAKHSQKKLKYNSIVFFIILGFALVGEGIFYNLNIVEEADNTLHSYVGKTGVLPVLSILSFVFSLFFFIFFAIVYFHHHASKDFWNVTPSIIMLLMSTGLSIVSYLFIILSLIFSETIRSLFLIIPLMTVPVWIIYNIVILIDIALKKYYQEESFIQQQ